MTMPLRVSWPWSCARAMPKSLIFATLVGGDEDVARLDVAVDGAGRVGRRERLGDLRPDPDGRLGGQRTVLGDHLRERAGRDVLHDQPDVVVLLHDVVDRDDVRMVEGRGRPGLPHRARQVRGRLARQCPDLLDRDVALEPLVAAEPDRAHAAAPDGSPDPVATRDPLRRLGCFPHHGAVPRRG